VHDAGAGTTQVYPTAVRTTGVGVANSVSNLGAVVAPFAVLGLVNGGSAGNTMLLLRSITYLAHIVFSTVRLGLRVFLSIRALAI